MKKMRAIGAAGALVVGLVAAPRLDAQVQLGWNSSMQVACLNTGCTNLLFTLNLTGLKPTDNNGNPVPAAIIALNSPGYPQAVSIQKLSPPSGFAFLTATVLSGGTWLSVPNGPAAFNFQTSTPFSAAPVVISATVTVGGASAFQYSGLAYLGANQECYNASGAVETCKATSYQQGDFNGLSTAVPEPMSMTLLATGLVGLGLISYRRRKKQTE